MKTTLPEIKLGRLNLHEIEPSDYLDYYEIGKDSETCRYLNWGPFIRPNEALWVINEIFYKRPEDGLPIGYGIYLKGKMIGMIDFHSYNKALNQAEVGYILNKDYWGMGIMQKSLRAVVDVGFNYLGLDKIICGHTKDNFRSKNTILNSGFHYEKEALVSLKDGMEIGYYYSIYKEEYEGGM